MSRRWVEILWHFQSIYKVIVYIYIIYIIATYSNAVIPKMYRKSSFTNVPNQVITTTVCQTK